MEPSNQVTGTARVKRGLAEMLKGGVIMDVVTADQARIAEEAGAVAVMALERVPADIRAQGGVARMSDPELVHQIMDRAGADVLSVGDSVSRAFLAMENEEDFTVDLGQDLEALEAAHQSEEEEPPLD